MDLQTRKLHFIEEILAINNEEIIEKLEVVLKKELLNPNLKQKLTSRAVTANQDIAESRVYSRNEIEALLKEKSPK